MDIDVNVFWCGLQDSMPIVILLEAVHLAEFLCSA